MKPSNVLSSDDILINTGTGTREKFYQNRIRKYLKEIDSAILDHDAGSEEAHSNVQKKKSRFDIVVNKCKLNRKDHLLSKKTGRKSIFKTEDNNLTIHKIINKETKIQRLIFGRDHKRRARKILEEEGIEEILVPPFFAWVHLS